MRWFFLILAAIDAGCAVAPPHAIWKSFMAFLAVLAFGGFVDLCLERHRP